MFALKGRDALAGHPLPTPSPQGDLMPLWFPIAGGQVREAQEERGDQARIGLATLASE